MIALENRLFTWEKWENFDTLVILFHYVKFIEDFGVFKKDESFYEVFINYNSGNIFAYNNKRILGKRQFFNLIPILGADG